MFIRRSPLPITPSVETKKKLPIQLQNKKYDTIKSLHVSYRNLGEKIPQRLAQVRYYLCLTAVVVASVIDRVLFPCRR